MLHKSLLLAACFCLVSAPMAMAQGTDLNYRRPAAVSAGQQYHDYNYGYCYTGKSGSGRVIPEARTENECMQTLGESWGKLGQYNNFNTER